MASRGELVIQGLVTLADAVGKPAGLVVDRNRAIPLDQAVHPSVVVYTVPAQQGVSERVDRADHDDDSARRTLTVIAEIRCRGNDSEAVEQQADEVYVWVVKQWLADSALVGLIEDIRELSWSLELQPLDAIYVQRFVVFEVEYYSQVADPELA